jgi:F5/8 type C domain
MARPPRFLVSVALVAVVVLAGAGLGAAEARTRVRPFSEVQASKLTFERDPSDPSRGIFRVTTKEPMICAIVWGPDARFGRFNNSLSMNGTGIAQHDVLLPDVEGGVRYTYVVEGTTADGTLYRSKIARFELPTVKTGSSPLTAGLRNVALGASVVATSSEFSAAFAGTNAVDGETATEWSTKGDGDRGSITLDLGQRTDIAAVEFVTRSMADGSAVTRRFTMTVDGGEPLGPLPAGSVAKPRPSKVEAVGRVVRFDVTASTGGNVGAVEIRVFAAA